MIKQSEIRSEWQSMAGWLNSLPEQSICPFRFPELEAVIKEFELAVFDSLCFQTQPTDFPSVEPSLNNLDEATLLALQNTLHIDHSDPRIELWSEKLLRSCEILRRDLKKRAVNRGQSLEDGKRKLLWLCLFFLQHYQVYNDARYLNIVLKILDLKWIRASIGGTQWTGPATDKQWFSVIKVLLHTIVEHSLATFSRDGVAENELTSVLIGLEPIPQLPMSDVFNPVSSPGVIVFSPSIYSLYTLAVLQLLKVHGVTVKAIVVRRMFNRERIFQEFSRDGVRLLHKAWRKLVLRGKVRAARKFQTLSQFLSSLGVVQKSIIEWGKDNNVTVHYCNTLNDQNVIGVLHATQPELVVFTGGGLIRDPVLKASGAGIINMHMGLLPRYRGMDVVEWPILEGRVDQVGMCIHFMEKGLDEGDILAMHYCPRENTQDIVQLRERMDELSPKVCVHATVKFLQGELKKKPQPLTDGKQYFIIHSRLYAVALTQYQNFRNTETRNGVNV